MVADPTTRHLLHRAQLDRGRAGPGPGPRRTPIVRRLERSIEVIGLLGACTAFVASVNRLMPSLGDQQLSEQDRATVRDHLNRVRAAADWCETVIDTGDASMDAQLAALLRDGGTP